jgi:hypothetical protein
VRAGELTYLQRSFELWGEPIDGHAQRVAAAVKDLSSQSEIESRGAVFTRSEVADFMLDLVGYQPDRPLHRLRFLEPCFGGGDFLLPAMKRLLMAWRSHGGTDSSELTDAVLGVELHRETYQATREIVLEFLRDEGIGAADREELANSWLVSGDFLLTHPKGSFGFVVGNPPYVRQELIPEALLTEYRRRYKTIYDRADLYVPFIEKSLSLLGNQGSLAFICADRWMKNKYGGPLRKLISDGFHLKCYIDMTDTPAFHADVIAYPAITLISRETPGSTRVALRPRIDRESLSTLAAELTAPGVVPLSGTVRETGQIANGSEPWLIESTGQLELIRRLETSYPTIESVGCRVGIGVATGADKAFIAPFDSLDVEPDRKLPLVMTRDIQSGEVNWLGKGVINPFEESGGLVDLRRYPRLAAYLESRREVIAGRHCAKKSPANWYRTIDRITPSLTDTPKLLIPDIKDAAHVVFEEGRYYPHHNLYFVTSSQWDLRALQAVLLSALARSFVSVYSTKMRGGFLRFQAQYLRRIRVPAWDSVPKRLRKKLHEAAVSRDLEACNEATFELFRLTSAEAALLRAGE